MPLRVEQLSLGPIGTNCYVVRDDAGGRSRRRRPERRRGRAPTPPRELGDVVRRDPRDARALGPPRRRRRPRRRHRSARATWPRASGRCSRIPNRFTPPGLVLQLAHPGRAPRRRGDDRGRGNRVRRRLRARPLAGASRVLRGRVSLLGRRPLRRLRRPDRPSRRRLGHVARVDPLARRPLSAGDRRLSGPRPVDDARRRARAATRSSPSFARSSPE